jgi:hypothetical protein
MEELLRRLKSRNGIERYAVSKEDGGTLRVDVWMDGNSYIDTAVTEVREELDALPERKTAA